MGITVEELGSENDEELSAFLDVVGAGSTSILGYHYPFYRDMLVAIDIGEPLYLGARCDGRLIGCLPAFVRRTDAGTVVSSLPYFGPNAGVLCADEERQEAHNALLAGIADRAHAMNALGCSIYTPFRCADFDLYDRVLGAWTAVEKFTQYRVLGDGNYDSSVGWSLRKAQRQGVEISRDVTPERVAAFYAIYERNCEEYGIPIKPRACVEFLTRAELLGTHTRLYTATRDGTVLGGLLMIWSPKVASYYIPCSLTEARSLQPTTMLIDAGMREAQERGMKYWNWESSPDRESGVYRFKKNWGGAVESSYRIYVESFAGKDKVAAL
jgi:hypothetical protein